MTDMRKLLEDIEDAIEDPNEDIHQFLKGLVQNVRWADHKHEYLIREILRKIKNSNRPVAVVIQEKIEELRSRCREILSKHRDLKTFMSGPSGIAGAIGIDADPDSLMKEWNRCDDQITFLSLVMNRRFDEVEQ